MGKHTVTIKVREEIARLVEEMIRLGIVENKNQAYNLLIEKGLNEVKKMVKYERKVEKMVEEFMKKDYHIRIYQHLKMFTRLGGDELYRH